VRRSCVLLAVLVVAGIASGPATALSKVQVPGLQVALYRYGFYHGRIDGIAGPMTKQAIRDFQHARRLEVDGVPGRRTRAALGRFGRPLFGKRTLHRGLFGYDVSVLQFLLAKRGFPPPRITSAFGGTTETLVRRFQRKHGLTVDGVVGPATRAALLGVKRRPVPVRDSIARWAQHYGVDVALVRGLAWQESGFQNHVRSGAGAFGVLQVTPATWDFVELFVIGQHVPRTSDGNVRVGTAYLAHLLHEFHGNARLALGAYYQGPGSVHRTGLFHETRHFVANVLALRGRV
jgi:hypothetical protein